MNHASLVRCRASVTRHFHFAILSLPDMWFDRHNLLAFFRLGQSNHLLSGQVATCLLGILAAKLGVSGYTERPAAVHLPQLYCITLMQ